MVLTFSSDLFPIKKKIKSITYHPIYKNGYVLLEISSMYNKVIWETIIYNRLSLYKKDLKTPPNIIYLILRNIRESNKFYVDKRGDLTNLPWGISELEQFINA